MELALSYTSLLYSFSKYDREIPSSLLSDKKESGRSIENLEYFIVLTNLHSIFLVYAFLFSKKSYSKINKHILVEPLKPYLRCIMPKIEEITNLSLQEFRESL